MRAHDPVAPLMSDLEAVAYDDIFSGMLLVLMPEHTPVIVIRREPASMVTVQLPQQHEFRVAATSLRRPC